MNLSSFYERNYFLEYPGARLQNQPPQNISLWDVNVFEPKAIKAFPVQENLLPLTWVSEWKSLSCVQFCDPMDYAVHRILQARILEWVTLPFFSGSSQPRDRTQVSHIVGGFFYQMSPQGSPLATQKNLYQGESPFFEGDLLAEINFICMAHMYGRANI